MANAARAAGLSPVVEGRSVDLRVMDGDTVAAAIRVHLEQGTWRYEAAARPGGHDRPIRTRHLADADAPVTADTLRPLDYYLAQVTTLRRSAPRPPAHPADTPAWMRVYAAT
ncbi:hypothetical protein [Nocardiopsis lucentensis]|uniref:hypothetical protein n=1 Tax=Nocardiopsis lucentensis TaxID=53441 RepID=UPI0012691849|nr:hypothetical protein [Nocardiopsis lucentensis]